MTTIREAWVRGAERLAAAGVDSARLDARVLLAQTMNLAPGETVAARAPSAEEMSRYEKSLARRMAGEPVAYITGEREFWSLPFAVGPGVLIPRPETETLVEQAERTFPDRAARLEVLDLGTGSGCLLIAFLHDYRAASGTGIDRSPEALSWARGNAATLGVSDRVTWQEDDWSSAAGTYDVIFSNPPYLGDDEGAALAPEVARHEPQQALFAGPEGLEAYRALAPVLVLCLKSRGRAFLEIGRGQANAVGRILVAGGLEILAVTPDLSGIPRCMAVRLAPGEL